MYIDLLCILHKVKMNKNRQYIYNSYKIDSMIIFIIYSTMLFKNIYTK